MEFEETMVLLLIQGKREAIMFHHRQMSALDKACDEPDIVFVVLFFDLIAIVGN